MLEQGEVLCVQLTRPETARSGSAQWKSQLSEMRHQLSVQPA
jgi:hypothetical protein